MSNEYFTAASVPANNAALSSSTMRGEFGSIEDGFDKLPTLTGNGSKIVAINSSGTAMEAIDLGVVTKYKTADEVRSSTATIAGDTHLTGWSLAADSVYKITGFLMYTTTGTDIDIAIGVDNAPQSGIWTPHTSEGTEYTISTTPTEGHFTALTRQCFGLFGQIHTHATLATALALQWAQQTSDSNAVTIHKGSWVTLELLGTA